jgi:hypothetical protein
MAIEGPLRELGIHDVFQLLDLSRKTGRLRVASALRDNEGTVYFENGRVISATVRSNPHPLGQLLVKAGKVTEGDLSRARMVQTERGETRRLGEILVSFGLVSHRELERQVRLQIEAVVFELMSWQEGFFSFEEGNVTAVAADAVASISAESLLMEGARRIDEWTRIAQRIPHLGVVPRLAEVDEEHPSFLDLLPHEWEVLAAIDGEADLRGIAITLGQSEFDVARICYGLASTNVVVLRDPTLKPVDPERVTQDLVTLLSDAREALAGRRPDDALSFAAMAIAVAPNDANARVVMAQALQALGREVEAEEELRRAVEHAPDCAPALMELAKSYMKRGELQRALASWQRVVSDCAESSEAARARAAIAHASQLFAVLETVGDA